jgi:hypothetical protein
MFTYKKLSVVFCLFAATICIADTKWVNGVLYGNVCRNGVQYSILFDPAYYKPVGSECDLISLDEHRVIGKGRISHE